MADHAGMLAKSTKAAQNPSYGVVAASHPVLNSDVETVPDPGIYANESDES